MEPRFEEMNEADVREEVIAPLVRRLGYRTGTDNNVIREQLLRYKFVFLGLKDPGKDPEVRGKADYILEAERRIRWVVEAKAPQVEIDNTVVEQAWSYANHPEVRAVYFAICNGHLLLVYRTADGPQAQAILRLTCSELDAQFQAIASLLEPASLIRDFPSYEADYGKPIGEGLRSLARITQGMVNYGETAGIALFLRELSTWIVDGSVQRNESGCLVALLKTVSPFPSIQRVNEKLGFADFEMVSADSELSSEEEHPTVFTYQNKLVIPADTEILNLNSWQNFTLPVDIPCELTAVARGVYRAREVRGTFQANIRYPNLPMTFDGTFNIHLA